MSGSDCSSDLGDYFLRSSNYLISQAQKSSYRDVYESLGGACSNPLISQLNLFLDENCIIRVQSKLQKLKAAYGERCPVLLDKNCPVAKSIIWDVHVNMGHSGIYKTLASIRKEFWITNGFVLVEKVLKGCLLCRRLNNRTVKINQNAYRDFRTNPEAVPFRNVCIDHCGPFLVKNSVGST